MFEILNIKKSSILRDIDFSYRGRIDPKTAVVGDNFGYGTFMSSDGSRTAIISYLYKANGVIVGKVDLFLIDADKNVTYLQTFTDPALVRESKFGHDVKFSKDNEYLIITARDKNATGEAFVYKLSNTGLYELVQIINPETNSKYFGISIAMYELGNSKTLILGFGGGTGSNRAGGYVVYHLGASGIFSKHHVYAVGADRSEANTYGVDIEVSSDGKILFVSDSGASLTGLATVGSVEIRELNELTGLYETKQILRSPVNYSGARFGDTIKIVPDASRLIVVSNTTVGAGAAIFVWVRDSSGQYVMSQSLAPIVNGDYERAAAISRDGNFILIGSRGYVTANSRIRGSLSLYKLSGSEYVLDKIYTLPTSELAPTGNSILGSAVATDSDFNIAISGNTVRALTTSGSVGTVYIFH